jgi:hypothetical protein
VPVEAGEGRTETAATGDPADGRYVDMNNVPLTGEQLRGTTGAVDAEQGTLAVAKRMPVQMRLLINQAELNRLLIACGNSPLKVEVQRLQFNPTADPAAPRGGTPPPRGATGQTGLPAKDRHYRTVELYGIISMYNPVNRSALGIEEPEQEEADESDSRADQDDSDVTPAPDDAAATAPATDSPTPEAAATPPDAATETPPATEPAGATP